MTETELNTTNKLFAEKGLNVPICNGYGQNEMAGAVALNTIQHNKNGSAGFPTYGTDIRIVDRNTLKDVPFNTSGLILEKSDSRFLYYMNMPEKTKRSTIILSDGSEWYDSTDIGYMDEDGFLFITGRTTRVIIKIDHKVSLDVIETKIKMAEPVQDAAAVSCALDDKVVVFLKLK